MPQKTTDIAQHLVIPLRDGSRQAFNRLFSLYSQRLYFFALGYLKSDKEAEEIVQETFIKLWERHGDLNPELSIHAYLFRIAFNFIRKRMIRAVREEELRHRLAGEVADFDDHTANALNYHFLLEHLTRLLEELPPRQKQILKLRKLEGYTSKEIAETLGLSLKTVEAHLTASLKFLKEKLQSENLNDLLLFALTFSAFPGSLHHHTRYGFAPPAMTAGLLQSGAGNEKKSTRTKGKIAPGDITGKSWST